MALPRCVVVLTLRNQFHDILPGSSIREAYVQTEAEMTGVIARAEAIAAARLAELAGPPVCPAALSGLSFRRQVRPVRRSERDVGELHVSAASFKL